MKLKVTELGVRQDGKPVKVGEVIKVAGEEIPASLVGKVRPLDGGEKTAVTNPKKDDGPAKTVQEVIEMADGNFMAFKSEASKLLGDKTPATKAEIVTSLEELATQPE